MYRRHLQGWMKHYDFIILDTVLLEFSFFLSVFLRDPGIFRSDGFLYRESGLVIAITCFLSSVFFGVHHNIIKRGYWQEVRNVAKLVITVLFILLGYSFFMRHEEEYSRLILSYFTILSFLSILIGNILWKKILLRNKKDAMNKNHMLVLTHSSIANEALGRIVDNSFYAYEVIGIVLIDDSMKIGEKIYNIPIVSYYNDAEKYILNKWVDEVLIWLPKNTPVSDVVLDKCIEMGITVHTRIYSNHETECQHTIEKYAGTTVLTESIRVASNKQLFVKRAMDILGAVVGLFFTAIFTVIIGPIIYFTDPGPIFFSQDRIGKNGRVFKIYKFRSMYKNAEARKAELMEKNKMKDNYMFKMDADPRILGSGPDGTKHGIGWFIRKTSIDEFPQFYCVLIGTMSLVGTRPPLLDEWKQYEAHHRARMAVRPGLTGLWQVSGRSNIQNFEDVIDLDMQYINNWDIGMDIKLILKTIAIIFTGKGAE